MKLIKNYIQYDADGYSAERKIAFETDGAISLTATIGLKMIPFAMDAEHREFIIFMIPRKKEANMYLWVCINRDNDGLEKKLIYRKNRITAVNDLMQYSKWTDEPMDVSGHFSEEILAEAVSAIQTWPDVKIWEALKAFEERLNETGGSQRWKHYDEEIQKGVKEARKSNKGIMFMY